MIATGAPSSNDPTTLRARRWAPCRVQPHPPGVLPSVVGSRIILHYVGSSGCTKRAADRQWEWRSARAVTLTARGVASHVDGTGRAVAREASLELAAIRECVASAVGSRRSSERSSCWRSRGCRPEWLGTQRRSRYRPSVLRRPSDQLRPSKRCLASSDADRCLARGTDGSKACPAPRDMTGLHQPGRLCRRPLTSGGAE